MDFLKKYGERIFYIILFCFFFASISATFYNYMILKNFTTFTVDDFDEDGNLITHD